MNKPQEDMIGSNRIFRNKQPNVYKNSLNEFKQIRVKERNN